MDGRHAIVNYKQTSNKQLARYICLLGLVYLLITVAMAMVLGVGIVIGRERGRGQNHSASVVQTTSQTELQNFTRPSNTSGAYHRRVGTTTTAQYVWGD